MSTLANILLTAAGATSSQEKPSTVNVSGTTNGAGGPFEKIMAHAMSGPSNKKTAANEQSQPPVPLDFSAGKTSTDVTQTIQPKTSGKSDSESNSGNTKKDSNLPASVEIPPVVVPEITVNQILAVAATNSAVILNPKSALAVAPPVTRTVTAPASVTISPNVPQKVVSAATKISAPDLVENQQSATRTLNPDKTTPSIAQNISGAIKNLDVIKSADTQPTAPANAKAAPVEEDHTATAPDNNISTPAQLQAVPGGTSIAKQDVAMNQAEKTNKIAGQNEKVLPGNAVSAAKANPASLFSSNAGPSVSMITANPSAPGDNNMTAPISLDSVAGPAMSDMRARILERTQDMVTLNAARLTESGNSTLQVVIKPDAGTQLSLELRQQNGSVQVQAVLQQGDFHHLNQQWPELQQRLDQRGIQLAPLTGDAASAGNGNSEPFQNKQNQPTEVVPELTLVERPANMFVPEPAPTSAHRGWETWA